MKWINFIMSIICFIAWIYLMFNNEIILAVLLILFSDIFYLRLEIERIKEVLDLD